MTYLTIKNQFVEIENTKTFQFYFWYYVYESEIFIYCTINIKKYNTENTIPKLLKIPNTPKILNNYMPKK